MTTGWRYAGASVMGTAHAGVPGSVCQDAHACVYMDRLRVLAGVVSDGAGSASHSAEGAQLLCAVVLGLIAAAKSEDVIHTQRFATETLNAVRGALKAQAAQADVSVEAFACTMLVAVIGEHRASFWQVGDGVICVRAAGEAICDYAFWPIKGEYANITEFVTDDDAHERLEFGSAEAEVVELALLSDGLERLALDFAAGEVHAKFFTALYPHLERHEPGYLPEIAAGMTAFLNSDRVNARTNDDKTLVLATKLATKLGAVPQDNRGV